MSEAEIACAEVGLAREIRKKILTRFRILVEQNPDLPMIVLANRAGTIGDVGGKTVMEWARIDSPKPIRPRPTQDDILTAVVVYERLVQEQPHRFRHELASEAGYPFGMQGIRVVAWAAKLGVKFPPATAHLKGTGRVSVSDDEAAGRIAALGNGAGGAGRRAAERFLALCEEYPDAPRKQHAYNVADEFGMERDTVEKAARKLQAERNGADGPATPEKSALSDSGVLTGQTV